MQMQQVHYFLALCEDLNFTRAARRCRVSQPSLTNGISALERDLGGALFDRKPSIALTGLGRMVRPYRASATRFTIAPTALMADPAPCLACHRPIGWSLGQI